MNFTNKFLFMSEAAAPFFENHEFEAGDYFGARSHICDNETFWKDTLGYKKDWKLVMSFRARELVCGICTEDCDPNYTQNCGHEAYISVFPVFRVDEILEMLQKCGKEPWEWNTSKPVDMMLAIIGRVNTTKETYFNDFKSFEELLLAFFMFVVHQRVWYNDRKKWMGAI
ncbi:hypothetical protein KAU33_02580 [Candidatus Dependentiae bacterium]|nr:hypothetical protein [Candidatus Dependentiae bacterium]